MEKKIMRIKIGTPRVKLSDGMSRLEAEVSMPYKGKQVKDIIFFEVDEKWGKYFTPELSDAFVLALFEVAIETGANIEYKAPMTEDLKYQMETYLIPVYARKCKGLKPFSLIGSTTCSRIESEGVVGTGFSAGVDSFYSVLKHIDSPYASKRVTHLMLAVNGAASTGFNAKEDQKWFSEEMKRFSKLADEMHLQLIGVNSNVSLLNKYRKLFKGGSGITTSSFVHALRKLFGTYYWASAYEADVLEFRTDNPGFMEPFFTPLLSVDGLRFYHSGTEVNRQEKVKYIADNPIVQKGLTVCGRPTSCGKCFKCTRTMAELYAIGKLDKYNKIFPGVKSYEKHLGKNLARELAQDDAPFTTEILSEMKRNGKNIPASTFLWKTLYFRPLFFFKKKLRYNKLAMKLYYEKGWADRLGEGLPDKDIVERRLAGEKLEK